MVAHSIIQVREGRVGLQGTGQLRRTLGADTVAPKAQLHEDRVGLQGTDHLRRTLGADTGVVKIQLKDSAT